LKQFTRFEVCYSLFSGNVKIDLQPNVGLDGWDREGEH